MVNRINSNTPRENNNSAEADASTAQGYSAKSKSSKSTNPVIDEVIANLANAHENRRARQVTEWERMHPLRMH